MWQMQADVCFPSQSVSWSLEFPLTSRKTRSREGVCRVKRKLEDIKMQVIHNRFEMRSADVIDKKCLTYSWEL